MSYALPETLPNLRTVLVDLGMDVAEFKTERQAAFMIQQLLGTRFKFPPKGQSCFPLLQRFEAAVTGDFPSEKAGTRFANTGKSRDSSCKAKRSKGFGGDSQRRSPVIGSQVSADDLQKRDTGNASSMVTGYVSSEAFGTTPKARKSKGRRAQNDLFATAPKRMQNSGRIGRAVPPGLVIYCDGACEPNPGVGGWGFVVYRDGVEIHADCGGSNPTTNNIMELTGALMALRWLDENTAGANLLHPQPARLFCDSMYVVNGCNEWRHGWKSRGWRRKGKNPEIANLDLWRDLDEALTLVPITLEWCKGHAGIIGNERADELSLEGREAVLALQLDPADLIEQQLAYSI